MCPWLVSLDWWFCVTNHGHLSGRFTLKGRYVGIWGACNGSSGLTIQYSQGPKIGTFFCHHFFDKSPNFWVHFFLSSYLTRISRMRVSVDSTTVKTFLDLYKTDGDTLKWTPYIVNSSSRKWPSKILDKRPYIVDSRHLTRLKSFAGFTGDFPLSCKSLLLVIKQRSHAQEKHFLELEVTQYYS